MLDRPFTDRESYMLGWKFGANNLPSAPIPPGVARLQPEAYLEGHRDGAKAYQAAQEKAFSYSDDRLS